MKRTKHEDDKLVRPGDLARWQNMFDDRSGLVLVIQTTRTPVQGLSTCLPLGSTQLIVRHNGGLRRLGDKDDAQSG